MKARYRAWYLGIAALALAPASVHLCSWFANPSTTVDPVMAEAGRTLFLHEWTPNDPLCGNGDGLGPVYNAASCVTCHSKGGTGGSGGREFNITMFTQFRMGPAATPRQGVLHKAGTHGPELLSQVDRRLPAVPPPSLEKLTQLTLGGVEGFPIDDASAGAHFSQRNTPALFGVKLIEEIPDGVILAGERAQGNRGAMRPPDFNEMRPPDFSEPMGRVSRLPDGRIGRFGWKAQTASLSDFVQAACASELGLGNPGQAAARPLYEPGYEAPAIDLTIEQCNQLTAFVASLPRPVERVPDDSTERNVAAVGRKLFRTTGCAECHTPNLGPVRGIYSDLLLHDMGDALSGGGGGYGDLRPDPAPSDGPTLAEWRTPPLWGVADSAPYLHDGRADTLEAAISAHGGEAKGALDRYLALTSAERRYVTAFLNTLRAP